MESRPRHNLDNPTLRGRLRGAGQGRLQHGHVGAEFKGYMSDVISLKSPERKPSHDPKIAPRSSISLSPGIDKSVANAKIAYTTKTQSATIAPVAVVKPRPDLPKQKRSIVLKRHFAKPQAYTVARKHRAHLIPTLLSGMAVVLFVAGILVLINSMRTNHTVKAQVKQLQKTENDSGISEGTPSESDPPTAASNTNYRVSPDLPRLLTIEKINVSARIRRVGVSSANVLNAPANIFDAGWYDGSAKPGENGTVVLDGHVSGPTMHGIFYSIGTLKAGDKISIERGDGKSFTYSVTGTQVFDNDKVDMSKVVTSSVPGKSGLNIMTCAGRFNVRTNQFEQRVVVFAVQD